MKQERLEVLLARFRQVRIAIIGDFFLDLYQYIDRSLDEVSIETGKTAYQITRKTATPGAAGTIASNLWRLEAGELYAIGVIGDDGNGYELRKGLRERNVNLDYLVVTESKMTPTYTKPMGFQPNQQPVEMNRFDIKNREPMGEALESQIIAHLNRCASHVDGIIVADQVQERNVGVITDRVREALVQLAQQQPDKLIWVDSRERIGEFRYMTIKPNRAEAYLALHPDEQRPQEETISMERAIKYGTQLCRRNEGPVMLTVGEDGALVFDPAGYQHVPGFPVTGPIDVVGAGDSFRLDVCWHFVLVPTYRKRQRVVSWCLPSRFRRLAKQVRPPMRKYSNEILSMTRKLGEHLCTCTPITVVIK